jgi:thermitase
MTERARPAAASQATQPPLPVPRGIAFRFGQAGRRPTLAAARAVARGPLPGWRVRAVEGLAGWFEAVPPTAGDRRPMRLGEFWARLRRLRAVEGVEAEPLLLIVNPRPASGLEADSFALGVGREQFGLWGWPYEREVEAAIREGRRPSDWHLEQMRVRQAWRLWEAKHPGRVPGDGVLVGHPDTGFTDHGELAGRFAVPGRSFLDDADEQIGALDDLALVGPVGFLEMPGHGTATASVIASGQRDPAPGEPEAFGVAPGARVLPLRVSRSVIHFDFGNVARAILHAVDAGADVISMSLGGPGYSGFVRECIGRALGEGVVVVSAAGNAVPATVFPAAFPEVIGVAATHAAKAPWRFSGIGSDSRGLVASTSLTSHRSSAVNSERNT